MTAAEIAARKALLAGIKSAFNPTAGATNAANTSLNAAVAAGQADLIPLRDAAKSAALALIAYAPKITAAVTAADALVPDDPPPPEPNLTPQDWATRSANRKLALPLMYSGPEDANLAGRHNTNPRNPRGVWDDGKGTRVFPVIDAKGLRYDVVAGKGVTDWYTDLGARYGANSTLYLQWQMMFSREFIDTLFEMTGGGYPGIKLAVISALDATSDSRKLVVTSAGQWNLVYLYQYWKGATANLYAPMPGTGGQQDIQPVIGQAPSCIYPAYAQAPRGTMPPGCVGLLADKWITFDLKIETGGLMAGETNQWDCERWLWMTIDGVKRLVIHYGTQSNQYIGRSAEPFEAIWFSPYMTNKSFTQVHPVASVWHRYLIADDKPIAPPKAIESPPVIIPGTLPPFVPPEGTFADFTLNTPYEARPPTLPSVYDIQRIFANWNSAAMLSDYSPRGGIAYHGGGEHGVGATDSCGVMMLNLETLLYEFRCRATQAYNQSSGVPQDVHPTNDFGEHADGSPGAPHTYNQAVEFPKAWGGGPRGSFLRAGGAAGGSTSAAMRAKALLDAGTIDADKYKAMLQAAGNAWSCVHAFDVSQEILGVRRLTNEAMHYGVMRNDPAYPDHGQFANWGSNYAAACKDLKRQGWWCKLGTSAATTFALVTPDGAVAYTGKKTGGAFPAIHHFSNDGQDVLMMVYTTNTKKYITLFDMKNGWASVDIEPQGPHPMLATDGNYYPGYMGLRWSDRMECFYGMDTYAAFPQPTVFYLRLSNLRDVMRSTFTWTKETFVGYNGAVMARTDPAYRNGAFSKLMECPQLESLVWTRGESARGQLLRPRAVG